MWTGIWVETLKAFTVISYVFQLYVGFEKINQSSSQYLYMDTLIACNEIAKH